MELYYPNVLRIFCLFGYEAIFISNVSYPVIVKLNLAFITPDRIRFYKTDNFPLSHRQYQLLMHIIFLCKIPIARFRWQLQYSRLLQLVHWGKMNWKVQYLMGECDTLGKEMTQLTEDKFFVVNTQTGKLVVAGYYDTNNNNKYDKQIRMKF